jgi:hypothetical protein
MTKNRKMTLDDVISLLKNEMLDARISIAFDILNLIKKGNKWDTLKDLFIDAPNILPSGKIWMSRDIQILIGKIISTRVVEHRNKGSKKKAFYELVDIYKARTGANPLVTAQAYIIKCSCGKEFIGREPEHQLFCDTCKRRNRSKLSTSQLQEFKNTQLPLMYHIIFERDLQDSVFMSALEKVRRLALLRGLSDDEIDDIFIGVKNEWCT